MMWPLAKYTFLESIRDRIYLGFFTGLVVLNLLFLAVGSSPWGLTNHIVERLGWLAVDVMLSLLTAIYAVNNLNRERERKILYGHLTLPLGRSRYLLGKALGITMSLTLLAFVGATVIIVGDWYLTAVESVPFHMYWMVPSVMLKCMILLGYAILLTQLSSSALTATLFTLGLYLISNGAEELLGLAANLSGLSRTLVEGVYYLIPNLQLVDFEQASLYAGGVTPERLGLGLGYAAAYVTATLVLACLVFGRKDL